MHSLYFCVEASEVVCRAPCCVALLLLPPFITSMRGLTFFSLDNSVKTPQMRKTGWARWEGYKDVDTTVTYCTTEVSYSRWKENMFIGISELKNKSKPLQGMLWSKIWDSVTWVNMGPIVLGKSFLITFKQTISVNTLRPKQIGSHFADDIFKYICFNENIWIAIEISLKFDPKGPINNVPPALVHIMALFWPGDKLLSEPMMVRLPTHIYICVTRPQWVNFLCL